MGKDGVEWDKFVGRRVLVTSAIVRERVGQYEVVERVVTEVSPSGKYVHLDNQDWVHISNIELVEVLENQ